eukprot:7279865-Prorocentrum_lima.AAC.1
MVLICAKSYGLHEIWGGWSGGRGQQMGGENVPGTIRGLSAEVHWCVMLEKYGWELGSVGGTCWAGHMWKAA